MFRMRNSETPCAEQSWRTGMISGSISCSSQYLI